MILARLLLVLLTVLPMFCWGQDEYVDSLKTELKTVANDTSKVRVLNAISNYIFSSAPDKAIEYGIQAKELAESLNDSTGIAYALKNIGLGYYIYGDYVNVSISWENSLAIFEAIEDDLGSANLLSNLGVVYSDQGEDAKAIEYYLRSLRLSEKVGDSLRIASALGNIGHVYASKDATHDKALGYFMDALIIGEVVDDPDIIGTSASNLGDMYYQKQQFDTALFYLEKSLAAFDNTADASLTLNLIGKVYASQGEYDRAIDYQEQAIDISTGFDAQFDLSEALLGLGNTLQLKGNTQEAIAIYLRAQGIANEVGADYILKDVYEGLSGSYASLSDFENAFTYQKLYDVVKDSIYDAETDDKIKTLQFSYEIDKKEVEIEVLEQTAEIEGLKIQRQETVIYTAAVMVILLAVLGGGLFNRYKYVRRTKRIIEQEKDRSQELLLNILPEETARELENNGAAVPKHYENVSVLFTDFKSFTSLAEALSSRELVEELNRYFSAFDDIVEANGLEKIKTIGDAFMCAGGIPTANLTHPENTIKAGLDIQAYMEASNHDRALRGLPPWYLRVGIHSGPVTAGVVGKKKYAYDIWGDTVNVASRMESNGEAGKVNISAATYELVKDKYTCSYRGKIEAKNKGEIDMYFVEQPISVTAEHQIA